MERSTRIYGFRSFLEGSQGFYHHVSTCIFVYFWGEAESNRAPERFTPPIRKQPHILHAFSLEHALYHVEECRSQADSAFRRHYVEFEYETPSWPFVIIDFHVGESCPFILMFEKEQPPVGFSLSFQYALEESLRVLTCQSLEIVSSQSQGR